MKIRKLTPALLKKIISEEKSKIRSSRNKKSARKRQSNANLIERKVDQLTKLALLEAKQLMRIKKIKLARAAIKKSLK